MKERPILFSAPMVRAVLREKNPKTQTRRVVSLREFQGSTTKGYDFTFRDKSMRWHDYRAADFIARKCPYGMPGDRLWVRETHAVITLADERVDRRVVAYRASCRGDTFDYFGSHGVTAIKVARWKPSIFMRRNESRITREVTAVRVERVQSISDEDAVAEGITRSIGGLWCGAPHKAHGCPRQHNSARVAFADLWDSINGKRPGCSWDDNPWVWVLTFKRTEAAS